MKPFLFLLLCTLSGLAGCPQKKTVQPNPGGTEIYLGPQTPISCSQKKTSDACDYIVSPMGNTTAAPLSWGFPEGYTECLMAHERRVNDIMVLQAETIKEYSYAVEYMRDLASPKVESEWQKHYPTIQAKLKKLGAMQEENWNQDVGVPVYSMEKSKFMEVKHGVGMTDACPKGYWLGEFRADNLHPANGTYDYRGASEGAVCVREDMAIKYLENPSRPHSIWDTGAIQKP